MVFLNKSIILLFIATFVISCSNDGKTDDYVRINKIVIDFCPPLYVDEPEVDAPSSRATDYGSGISSDFRFEYLDTVGIFTKDGSQIPFALPVPMGGTLTSVALLAQGWMTKLGEIYALYLPYNFYNRDSRKLPWDGRFT